MKILNRREHPNYSRCETYIHNDTKDKLQILSHTLKISYSVLIENLIEEKYEEVFYHDNNGNELL